MECVSVVTATYIKDFRIYVVFNTGEAGEVDLQDTVNKYPAAKTLRDPAFFARFHLDSWPTLTWDCGFDVAPETLYALAGFDNLIRKARQQARASGMKRSDIVKAITRAKSKK